MIFADVSLKLYSISNLKGHKNVGALDELILNCTFSLREWSISNGLFPTVELQMLPNGRTKLSTTPRHIWSKHSDLSVFKRANDIFSSSSHSLRRSPRCKYIRRSSERRFSRWLGSNWLARNLNCLLEAVSAVASVLVTAITLANAKYPVIDGFRYNLTIKKCQNC